MKKVKSIALMLSCLALALPLQAQNNESGEKLFQRHCAICHGVDAKGVNSQDAKLGKDRKHPAADLTLLAKNNAGHFPYLKIRSSIDGRVERGKVRAHYDSDMPIWGREFVTSKTLAGQVRDEAVAKMRILNLVDYLAEIQQP